MIKEYLEERKLILTEIIRNNKEKYEHNKIVINESYNQIKELDETIDEASKIFSVKAREDNGFKNQEISELENKIAAYTIENKEYEKNIQTTEKELSMVMKCFEELEKETSNEIGNNANNKKDNVSRETYETKSKENVQLEFDEILEKTNIDIDKYKIIQKLEFCKNIAEIDGKRVNIELDNIINMIKK